MKDLKLNIDTKLKKLRKDRHISQKEISKVINKSQQAYAKYELGLAEPDLETMTKLAEFYHISLDSLCGYVELHEYKDKKDLPVEDNTITVYGRGTGKKVYKVSPKRLKAIQALLDEDDQSDDIDF